MGDNPRGITMFVHLDLGNGFNYYMTAQLLAKGVEAVEASRKLESVDIPEGDVKNSIMKHQAEFMYCVVPESRA
jgi:hypothetical protein